MSLTKRLERLEAELRSRSREDEFWVCRELIYDPREWEIGEEEDIARMQAEELDRLVAAGEIKESDRERVTFIVRTLIESLNRNEPRPMIQREDAA